MEYELLRFGETISNYVKNLNNKFKISFAGYQFFQEIELEGFIIRQLGL